MASAMPDPPARSIEPETGHDDQIEAAVVRPPRPARLQDSARPLRQPILRPQPGESIPTGLRIPGRHGHALACPAGGGKDTIGGGFAGSGEIDRDCASGAKRGQPRQTSRRASRERGQPARIGGGPQTTQPTAHRGFPRQDGWGGIRG